MVHFCPWDPLKPCLVHLAAFLFHFSSEMRSRKIKSVKKDFSVRLDPYLVRFGPYGPFWPIWSIWDHVWSILLHFCSISVQKCAQEKSSQERVFRPFLIRLGPRLVRFGPYGLFRTMIGPSCRIAVSFMFRNVQRQDQVSIGSFVYTFCNFHYLCAPFDPFWSNFGPLGPNYETI